ncbi:MAG: 4-hydroxythreonine-4-phosphate dehydrogenase PdxA [Pyrinomonadaceae bacterium]|nr:4-hydroxythreonine-4-phosphate dehydrogenase PdxA [Pyrinomonadaceae bacterium]
MVKFANDLPTIGITMGDAAGIGPEIVLKSLAAGYSADINSIIIGDGDHLRSVAFKLGVQDVLERENIAIDDLANLSRAFEPGTDCAVTGRASAEYIERAVQLWRDGRIDAVATAPISKKAIALGGYDFPGHTEFLAKLTNTRRFAMSFFAGKLRVVLLSTHLPLVQAIELVKKDRLAELIMFSHEQLSRLLKRVPKIAVAGLNPHASEGGLFGTEETTEIAPAIESCRTKGVDVSGPYSPDTVFLRCSNGEFDAVIALYHDQATIPVKSMSFNSGVNVTLGLPLIRTSVDHGTAFEIAGKGIAEYSSMSAAIDLAAKLVSGSWLPASI